MTRADDEQAEVVSALRAQLAESEKAQAALMQSRDAYQHHINLIEQELAEAQKSLLRAEAQHRARVEDIAVLTADFCAQLSNPEQTAFSQNEKFLSLQEQVEALSRELHDVAHHRQSLLNSTSWRITRPLRALAELFRRARRP